jgi:hypothetical protein
MRETTSVAHRVVVHMLNYERRRRFLTFTNNAIDILPTPFQDYD